VGRRALRPAQSFDLPSGRWIVDASQPVAVVLDPHTEAPPRVVSWSRLPPPPPHQDDVLRMVRADGDSLWVQEAPGGPLARVGLEGVAVVTWTRGLRLAAAGHGAAWCASAPRRQELVAGASPQPTGQPGQDLLLRVDHTGSATVVRTEQRVGSLRAEADGLLVEVEAGGWHLRELGMGFAEVVRETRWLRLPWEASVPTTLDVQTYCVAAAPPPLPHRAALTGAELRATGSVDITDGCWPLEPRPADAGSYAEQVLATNAGLGPPMIPDLAGITAALVGEWPDTLLQWTFGLDRYPGLALRRRVPLFDELGRIDPPTYAAVHLMEDLATRPLPPPTQARDGVLDI